MSAERIALSDADVAYLVGRGGQTRIRLENFSGARMQIDRDAAEVCDAAISHGATTRRALNFAAPLSRAMLGVLSLPRFLHFVLPRFERIGLFASPLSRME